MGIHGNSQKKLKKKVFPDKELETLSDEDEDAAIDVDIRNKTENENQDGGENDEIDLDLVSDTKLHLVSAGDHLKRFIFKSTGQTLDTKITEILDKYGKVATFLVGETIIRSGEESCGFFTIIEGTVNVLTADDSLIIGRLSDGEVFGEMSTIFGMPCSANIKAETEVKAVVIEPEPAFLLFEDFADNLDIIDWYVKHRYLPIGEFVDTLRVYRRMGLNYLKHIPLLGSWNLEDLKQLILSFDCGIVILYPPSATLVSIDDPMHSILVVIRGTIKLEGPNYERTMDVSMYDRPFIYGHLCLTSDEHLSPMTIKAITNCLVIAVEKDWILEVISRDQNKIVTFEEKARRLIEFKHKIVRYAKEYGAAIYYDIIYQYVKSSEMYADEHLDSVERKIADAVFEDFSEGVSVLLGVEKGRYEAIVVIDGSLNLTATTSVRNDKSSDIHVVNAVEEAPKDELSSAGARASFIQGSVVDLSMQDLETLLLKSSGRAIVCKIKKNSEEGQCTIKDREIIPVGQTSVKAFDLQEEGRAVTKDNETRVHGRSGINDQAVKDNEETPNEIGTDVVDTQPTVENVTSNGLEFV